MKLSVDGKNLRNNFIWLLILRVGNYLIPLITLPFLVSVLGVEKFGLVSFAEMIILYFKSLTDYGFDLSGTRVISENRSNRLERDKLVSIILSSKIILAFLGLIVLIVLIHLFPIMNNEALLFLFSYGIVIGNTFLPVWFFQGIEKMKYITIVNFLSRLLYIGLLFLFVNTEEDYYYVPLLNSIGLIFGGAVSFSIMRKIFDVKLSLPSKKDILNQLKEGFNVFVITLAPNLYNNSLGVFVGIFTNNTQVGYYSAATKITEVGISFVNIFSNTIYPYLSRSNNYRKKLVNGLLLVGFCVSLFFLLFHKKLIFVLFGEVMKPSILIFQILALSPFFIAIMNAYGINTLILQRKEKIVRSIVLFYSLLGFLLGLFFIKSHGVIAAAIILVAIRGLIGLTEMGIVKRTMNVK